MKKAETIRVTHLFEPDPEAVRQAMEALIRLSDEARAKRKAAEARKVRPQQAS